MTDRELYHRLQNYSAYPSSIALARRRILNEMQHMLAQSDELAQDPLHIFSLPKRFDAEAYRDFLQRQHDATTQKYTEYGKRRDAAYRQAKADGMKHTEAKLQGMEMFGSGREAAQAWLRKASVVKYVDGAWLQHLLRVTTAHGHDSRDTDFSSDAARKDWIRQQRTAARASWQVMTEELGDGDLSRSHVAIYEDLMDKLAKEDGSPSPPKGEERAFIEMPEVGGASDAKGNNLDRTTGNARCWRSGLSQLALSVSPNEFLPESIGWNSSYEGLPYHLLLSSRELQELDLDAYYFWLHISIDNASSGHSAMARECVVSFIEAAKQAKGQSFADEMWARVKLGFALADHIPTTPVLGVDAVDDTPEELTYTVLTQGDAGQADKWAQDKSRSEARIAARTKACKVLASKAAIAHGLHGGVKARLAGESLSYWLEPAQVDERVPRLLDALADNPVWIKPGYPKQSKFIQEFEWGGKMFGALTASEVEVLRRWVATMEEKQAGAETEQEDVVALVDDSKAEEDARQSIHAWLAQQRGDEQSLSSTSHLAPSSWLRPFALPETLDAVRSWDDLASLANGNAVLAAVIEQPDAVRPLPDGLAAILDGLDGVKQTFAAASLNSQGTNASASLQDSHTAPVVTSQNDVTSLLPSIALLPALLEHSISLSPGRLASPLGMSAVKYLRILHGFTEESDPSEQLERGGDGAHIGCMGTEDSMDEEAVGWWELVEKAWSCNDDGQPVEGSPAMLLHDFVARASAVPGGHSTTALPALILLLGQHFWNTAPLLLGIGLAILRVVAHEDVVLDRLAAHEAGTSRDELVRRVRMATAWLERAVAVGSDTTLPRGVDLQVIGGGSWSDQVARGWRLGCQGMQTAMRGEQ